ncbi:Arc family DNA-binding protein [Devosia sp.]|uniref:Arc family DNA-binding protein n=1 Tax=Devosia sp. TaxID=1871048 RepID=UPI001ACDE354|nr:Arc family DNA-binding protein [Devosia sp.]MBN9334909.1 Arc family DNA-binding protein [Devosia sp.]
MQREAEKYIVRFPDGMRDRLRQQAKANRRSMNSEIVHHLDRALAAENENGPAATAIAPSLNTTNP